MLKLIKKLLERNSLFFAIASSFIVLVLSLISMKGVPNVSLSYADKIEHFLAYGTITFFWLLSRQLGKIKVSFYGLIFAILIYSAIIELLQAFLTTHRTGDGLDLIANSIGIVVGCLIFKLLNRIYLQV